MGYHRWKIGGKWAENRRNFAQNHRFVLPGNILNLVPEGVANSNGEPSIHPIPDLLHIHHRFCLVPVGSHADVGLQHRADASQEGSGLGWLLARCQKLLLEVILHNHGHVAGGLILLKTFVFPQHSWPWSRGWQSPKISLYFYVMISPFGQSEGAGHLLLSLLMTQDCDLQQVLCL